MDQVLTLLAAAAAKATVVLILAGIVTTVWRSASASSRHLVWTAAIVSSLVIPVVAVVVARAGLPRLAIPAWTPVVTVTANIAPLAEPVAGGALPVVAPEPAAIEVVESPVTARIELPALAAVVASSVTGDVFGGWQKAVLALWAAGTMVALLPFLVALARVHGISRRANRAGQRWTRVMRETPAISHLASRVRILESVDTSMPMTWGLLRPTMLVPSGAERWPDWKCRNILLHELAHVERRDCLTQLLAHVACAVYWFNPLFWVAAHRMRVERELACDDRVISAGAPAAAYAENLLDVARSLRAPSFTSPTAIAMARPSQLSGRLLAVLDARRNRRSVNRSTFAGASLAALVVIATLASVTTRAAVAAAPSQNPAHETRTLPSMQAGETTTGFLPRPLAIVHATQGQSLGLTPSAAPPMLSLQGSTSCWATPGDGKSSVSIHDGGGSTGRTWTVRYSRDGCSLELRAEGTFKITTDLTDLESLSSGGWFRIEEREGRSSRRLEIRNDGRGLERSFWVNDDRATYDAAAQAWLAGTLLEVERRTAFSADTRVPELYRTAGLASVLSEIALMRGTHATSRYYGALLQMDVRLDTNTLNEVVRSASRDFRSSDYYMSEVLGKLAAYPSANEATWRTFAEAAGRMKSDYYKAAVLKKVLSSGKPGAETSGVILRSVSGMKSDYYKSQSLMSLANSGRVADWRGYFSAASAMESDHYRKETLIAALRHEQLNREIVSGVINSVSRIKSGHAASEVLSAAARSYRLDDQLRSEYEKVAESITSKHYRTSALAALNRSASR